MAKQINWVSLSLKIIDKQNPALSSEAKTIRYIQSYLDTLLDKGRLTEKQSAGLIRNIDIHLGIAIPNQIVQIGRTTAWTWKKKLRAPTPVQPVQTEAVGIDAHWQALLDHYGSWEAVAHAAVDRLEPQTPQADTPASEETPRPLDRNQQVTVSIWERTDSGNLDYKDGKKEHVVFTNSFKAAQRKLKDAGAPDRLWNSLAIALDGLDERWALSYGIVHAAGDPKGRKAPSNPDLIVLKATPITNDVKPFVTFVQSSYPMTSLTGMDDWKKRTGKQPDIKGWIAGFGEPR